MISDEEVVQHFKDILSYPDVLTGFLRAHNRQGNTYNSDSRIHLQVFRGKAMRYWSEAPKSGCKRCMALFNDYDVIPKYCFDCYKVLITVQSVLELFKLLMLFEKLALPENNTRKCMIDRRPVSSDIYKGFIYCRGVDEANEICKTVEESVKENISTSATVSVKRGCSEYAAKYPEYTQFENNDFQYKDDWKFYEEFVDKHWIFYENFPDTYDEDGKGTDPMREIIAFQWWLRYAATAGDESYLMVNGNKKLQPLK